MTTVKIDKGVPVPPPHRNKGAPAKWPWRDMEPGDSFFAPGYVQALAQRTVDKERLLSISTIKRTIPGTSWTTRLVTEDGVRGVRVWRRT